MTYNNICNNSHKDVAISDTRYDLSLFYNVQDKCNEPGFFIKTNDTFSDINQLFKNYNYDQDCIKEREEGDQNGYIELNEKLINEKKLNDYDEKNTSYDNIIYLNNNKNKENTTLNKEYEWIQKYTHQMIVMKKISNCRHMMIYVIII
ncbi:hypothetical protein PFDG_05534 [Plasmodium falciparum Dd2]|uniref:Uncharacterized protein n=1 Tax=Plasmodium falciparum (isolate Dd2) TaxID=57267 RepID=A0A0L7M3R3_PLAF4|nr:hypothetical protein PFDG_05534 [Plasmodium falciparum Dd2]